MSSVPQKLTGSLEDFVLPQQPGILHVVPSHTADVLPSVSAPVLHLLTYSTRTSVPGVRRALGTHWAKGNTY